MKAWYLNDYLNTFTYIRDYVFIAVDGLKPARDILKHFLSFSPCFMSLPTIT